MPGFDLKSYLERFPEVCRCKFGRAYTLSKPEKEFEQVRTGGRQLTPRDENLRSRANTLRPLLAQAARKGTQQCAQQAASAAGADNWGWQGTGRAPAERVSQSWPGVAHITVRSCGNVRHFQHAYREPPPDSPPAHRGPLSRFL